MVQGNHPPFDYVVVATKNCPDIHPTVEEIIAPAVTEGHTVVVLIQNGINIEKPLIKAFPTNIILSGVSLIGTAEKGHGHIIHDDHDELIVGAFNNPGVSQDAASAAAAEFVDMYRTSGKVKCVLNGDVGFVRWRKLVYNATFNPVATILRMDTSRMRVAKFPIEALIKPAMWEIWNTAKAAGHPLPDAHVDKTVEADPFDVWCKPSMLQDAQKVRDTQPLDPTPSPPSIHCYVNTILTITQGNYIEYENLVGEPIKEAERLGVPTPTLKIIYGFCAGLQWQTKEAKGLIELPAGAPAP